MRRNEPLHTVSVIHFGTTTMENNVEGPQKFKNGTAVWSSNSLSGYLSKEYQNTNLKRYVHPHVDCSIIFTSQQMEWS